MAQEAVDEYRSLMETLAQSEDPLAAERQLEHPRPAIRSTLLNIEEQRAESFHGTTADYVAISTPNIPSSPSPAAAEELERPLVVADPFDGLPLRQTNTIMRHDQQATPYLRKDEDRSADNLQSFQLNSSTLHQAASETFWSDRNVDDDLAIIISASQSLCSSFVDQVTTSMKALKMKHEAQISETSKRLLSQKAKEVHAAQEQLNALCEDLKYEREHRIAAEQRAVILVDRFSAFITAKASKQSVYKAFNLWATKTQNARSDRQNLKVADWFHKKRLALEVFQIWKTETAKQKFYHRRLERKRAIQNAEHNVRKEYEDKMNEMQSRIGALEEELRINYSKKLRMEEDLRRVFLRGVSAMNMEALTLFRTSPEDMSALMNTSAGPSTSMLSQDDHHERSFTSAQRHEREEEREPGIQHPVGYNTSFRPQPAESRRAMENRKTSTSLARSCEYVETVHVNETKNRVPNGVEKSSASTILLAEMGEGERRAPQKVKKNVIDASLSLSMTRDNPGKRLVTRKNKSFESSVGADHFSRSYVSEMVKDLSSKANPANESRLQQNSSLHDYEESTPRKPPKPVAMQIKTKRTLMSSRSALPPAA